MRKKPKLKLDAKEGFHNEYSAFNAALTCSDVRQTKVGNNNCCCLISSTLITMETCHISLTWPHILRRIFFNLDFDSYKTCYDVCKVWNAFLTSELIQEKAKLVFHVEILCDQRKLALATKDGETDVVLRLLASGLLDVNFDCLDYWGV